MPRKRQDTLTRAERIRRRRQQASSGAAASRKQKRSRTNKSATATAAAGAPVVVSRYGVVGEAVAQPSTGRVRRQVRVARDRNTEVVASLPGVSLGGRWISLGLSVLLFAVVVALWYAPMFRVDVPEIHGVHSLDAGQVADALPVSQRPIFALSPQELAKNLEDFPIVRKAAVSVHFPNRVVVTVEERQPVLVWQTMRRDWWVDADGVAYTPPANATVPEGVLVVKADETPFSVSEVRPGVLQILSPEQVHALQTLGRYVPEGTPLVYHPLYGIGWQAEEGWRVYVGQNLTQMDQRMALYQVVAAWLNEKDLHPALVNMTSLKAPYYRMEP